MGPVHIKRLGALIRWRIKGRKTKLEDEIFGRLESKTPLGYDLENLLIGLVPFGIVFVIILILLDKGKL